MIDLEHALDVEPIKKPAKQWVVHFRAEAAFTLIAGNGRFYVCAGDEFRNRPFPTFEVAEQRADDLVKQAALKGGALTVVCIVEDDQ